MEVTYGGQKYSAQFSTRVLQGKWGGEGGLAAGVERRSWDGAGRGWDGVPASEVLLTGVFEVGEIHLERRCASEGLLKGVSPKGEFHETTRPAPEARLTGVAPTGEIHLKTQCASEGIVEGVRL